MEKKVKRPWKVLEHPWGKFRQGYEIPRSQTHQKQSKCHLEAWIEIIFQCCINHLTLAIAQGDAWCSLYEKQTAGSIH